MDFEDSSLYNEVQAIQNSDEKSQFTWRVQLHIGVTDYDVYKATEIDELCDFEVNFAKEMMVTVQIPGGMYAYDIYPNKNNIEMTLFKYPLLESGDASDDDSPVQSERYKAILKDTGDPVMEANGMNHPTREALDLTNIIPAQFQLIEQSVEQLRLMTVGGIYRGAKVADVIKSILTTESAKIDVPQEHEVQGVDMIKASNDKIRDHIIIPHGMPLVAVPEYIHQHCGGVYNTGMGYFFQDDYWFVYPCYDTTRFDTAHSTITVINVPKNKFVGTERSFRQDGDNLVVMATGDVKFRNDSNKQQLTGGNGVRFADADNFLTGFITTKNNKAIASRASNNSEFTSVTRDDGLNNVRMSDNPITSNPYVEYSKLARRNGGVFAFTWENSDPSLIKPGTMVKIMYLQEDDIVEIFGVLLKVASYHHLLGTGQTATRYRTNTMLSIFVQPPDPQAST